MLKIFRKISNFFDNLGEKHAFAVCFSNACKGMPNSQLDVAKHYFENQDFVEAYAWAEVASCNKQANQSAAEIIKHHSSAKLSPEKMTLASEYAAKYKKHHLPKRYR